VNPTWLMIALLLTALETCGGVAVLALCVVAAAGDRALGAK
jgi:hypothetical protein